MDGGGMASDNPFDLFGNIFSKSGGFENMSREVKQGIETTKTSPD